MTRTRNDALRDYESHQAKAESQSQKPTEEMEGERVELLRIRNQAMREAASITNRLEGLDKRRVLFHILDEHDREVESISESLNLRELAVKAILEELERDYLG